VTLLLYFPSLSKNAVPSIVLTHLRGVRNAARKNPNFMEMGPAGTKKENEKKNASQAD
jgi:hypothetical protein